MDASVWAYMYTYIRTFMRFYANTKCIRARRDDISDPSVGSVGPDWTTNTRHIPQSPQPPVSMIKRVQRNMLVGVRPPAAAVVGAT